MTKLLSMLGKSIGLSLDDSVASSLLAQELAVYPTVPALEQPELEIRHGAFALPDCGLVNPKTHHELPDGFVARFGATVVRWVLEEGKLRRIDFHLRPSRTKGVTPHLRRMWSHQFTSRDESIGQIFHELVLIPSVYFDPAQFLVHASGLQAPDGGVTLIGGTGGVGKTSLELELCRHHGFRFVADDIAVIDGSGHVWPNLAFPKIYGYNLEGDNELQELVLGRSGWNDRLNWRVHSLRGADRVRRRVSPARLYPAFSTEGGPLERYIFIAREVRDDIVVERGSPEMLAALSTTVMDAEYQTFHNHLAWHQLNRLLSHETPVLTRDAILARWRALAGGVLKKVECTIIRAPRAMDHRDFKQRMVALIAAHDAAA